MKIVHWSNGKVENFSNGSIGYSNGPTWGHVGLDGEDHFVGSETLNSQHACPHCININIHNHTNIDVDKDWDDLMKLITYKGTKIKIRGMETSNGIKKRRIMYKIKNMKKRYVVEESVKTLDEWSNFIIIAKNVKYKDGLIFFEVGYK